MPESLDITCGYCRTDVEAKIVSEAFEVGRSEQMNFRTSVRAAAAYRCPRAQCGNLSVVFIDFTTTLEGSYGHDIVLQLPRGTATPMEGLPPEIEADREEAWSCLHGGDFRAAVIMGRAAIQRAVRSLGAAGGRLIDEIDDLLTKGVITKTLRDMADEVRIAGNDAAHPEDLGAVNRDEVLESLAFMDEFLEHAIAFPAKREARKAAREQS